MFRSFGGQPLGPPKRGRSGTFGGDPQKGKKVRK